MFKYYCLPGQQQHFKNLYHKKYLTQAFFLLSSKNDVPPSKNHRKQPIAIATHFHPVSLNIVLNLSRIHFGKSPGLKRCGALLSFSNCF